MVKDWLLSEEQEAIPIKGFSKPVRTYRVLGTSEGFENDATDFHHEDNGVKISIQGNVVDKQKTKEALERALGQLD